jgi:hypothetical protein
MNAEIKAKLEEIAIQKTSAYCYPCSKQAPSGRCDLCMSGVGCEYGLDWVIESLILDNLHPIDVAEQFEESVSGCYSETVKIGWIEVDTVTALKELDPISWKMAQNEWIDQELDNEIVMEIDGKYYETWEIENFINKELGLFNLAS